MGNRHLIGKQVFEMELNSAENAYAIQQEVSTILKHKMTLELEKLFDGFANDNEVLCIDYLEIDLGIIDPKNLNDLMGLVLKTLDSALREKMQQSTREKLDTKSYDLDMFNKASRDKKKDYNYQDKSKDSINSNDASTEKNHFIEQATVAQGSQALHIYYFNLWLDWLVKGTLPSYAIHPEKDLIFYVLEALVLDNEAVERLRLKIKEHPIALERLVLQHRVTDLVSIMELYTGFSHKKLPELITDFLKTIIKGKTKSKTLNQRQQEVLIWKQIFQRVILDKEKLDLVVVKASLKKIPLKENKQLVEKEDMETPQFFKNAGVILLHPFLNTFFKQLGLLKGATFKNISCQSKAVLLLHFLATGEEKVPEYEMYLPKFLCGMPANMPLDHTLKISKKEKKEAFNLLEAVIDHWGALGSTSPEGLQEGFLRREGKLEKEQTGWKLYVEQKTLDMLLDKLPWNLSLVKLAWMQEILKVEWR